jgi:hypothetical protein
MIRGVWTRLLLFLFALAVPLRAAPQTPAEIATQILAPLLDPVKVATLKGDRPANARLYRVLYWLETARLAGGEVGEILTTAQTTAGYAGTPMAAADQRAIAWSRKKLDDYGCFDEAGLEKLRKGGSPVITKGNFTGAPDRVGPRAAARGGA